MKNLRLSPRIIAAYTTASVGPFSQLYVVVADRFRRSDSRFLSLAHGHELRTLCSSSSVAEQECCMRSRQSLLCQSRRGTISTKREWPPHKAGVTSVYSFQEHGDQHLYSFLGLNRRIQQFCAFPSVRQLGTGCHGKSDMETQIAIRYPHTKIIKRHV